MIEELDVYLKGNLSEDYWYDDALFICEEILQEFTNEEWQRLIDKLPKENDIWKIKLAECLGEIKNNYELECILQMINTENKNLFVACVDSLRGLDLKSIDKDMKLEIVNKCNILINKMTEPAQIVILEFLKKINS